MNILLFAIIATVFGGLLPSIKKEKSAASYGWTISINFVIFLFIGYFFTPHLYFFSGVFWLIAVAAIINSIIGALDDGYIEEWTIGATYSTVFWVILLFVLIGGTPFIESSRYRDMIGEVEESNWVKDMHPFDESHVRLVSIETAEFLGNKVIGEADGSLGSRYKMGNYSIQKVRGEQYWVAPLEFIGFWKWRKFKHSPGFVMVSAEDPLRKPELFLGYKMEYMLSSCFSKDLDRFMYNKGYAFTGLTEYTFELDDEERPNPWHVITIHHPEAGFLLQKVDGVVIVNPETGELHKDTPVRGYFTPEEAPLWVDRIYPEEYVENYIEWNGKYILGWWNFSETNVEVPTSYNGDGNEVWLTFGDVGGQNWFTGITSASSEDQSLTGFVLVDSRTGKARKYKLTGANEEAVIDAVNSEFSNFNGQYVAVQPILRNINGELAWICPVVTAYKGILKRIAIVNRTSLKVSSGENLFEALSDYEMTLTGSGFNVALTNSSSFVTIENANIVRWNSTSDKRGQVYYFTIKESPGNIFMVTANTSSEVLVTRQKDKVSISYIETKKSIVPVKIFDNLLLDIEKADIQKSLNTRRDSIKKKMDKKADAKEFKKEIENMTPEELLKLKEKLNK